MSAPTAPRAAATTAARSKVGAPRFRWETQYRFGVILGDLGVLMLALAGGLAATDGNLHLIGMRGGLALVSGVSVAISLLCWRAWDLRVLGQGSDEFRRLTSAVGSATVALAMIGLALEAGNLRPWVFMVLPGVWLGLVASRLVMRRILHSRRSRNSCMLPTIVAGSIDEVGDLIGRSRRGPHYGWLVEAACVPAGPDGWLPAEVAGVPVVGKLDDLATLVRLGGYRIVVVAPDPSWNRVRLRDLGWQLEGTPSELVVAPALMEVTGPRLHVSPVFGLTLLRVSKPTFTGARWAVKTVLDRVLAGLALVFLAPLFAAVACAIKLEDGGPVLYKQDRIGQSGGRFPMLKFRSMIVGADQLRGGLDVLNEGSGPLFKLRRDPRVTGVGRLIRKYSLDELPQLWNVVVGHMSLVGPRPPLEHEVAQYEIDAKRRLLVRPGITGLWQVSGRSDLSWEETVRLDLRYVENWSLALDASILIKTAGAVLRGDGAY